MAVFEHAAGAVTVHLIEACMANYIYVVEWEGGCLVVDPAEARAVSRLLRERELAPAHILATHHHGDHVAGIPELKHAYDCAVTGPAGSGIPGVDREVGEGDRVDVGPLQFEVMETPGHTATDISYYARDAGILFCGDTLFSAGCGRLFECGADVMWRSLQRLRALPDDTRLFCGHEYTENNLRFAAAALPGDDAIASACRQVREHRAAGRPTLPSTIGDEKRINPFLRADEPGVQDALGMPGRSGEAVFAELRRRKDRF